jgi:hypothetical protein
VVGRGAANATRFLAKASPTGMLGHVRGFQQTPRHALEIITKGGWGFPNPWTSPASDGPQTAQSRELKIRNQDCP